MMRSPRLKLDQKAEDGDTTSVSSKQPDRTRKRTSKVRTQSGHKKSIGTQGLPLKLSKLQSPSDDIHNSGYKEKKIEHIFNTSDSENDKDASFSYLKLREQNIKANEDFFAKLCISKAKELLNMASLSKKVLPTQRGLKVKREPQELPPRRQSLRIRHIDPVGNPLPKPYPTPEATEESRLPPGPVNMKDCVYAKNDEIIHDYVKSLASLINHLQPESKRPKVKNLKLFHSSLDDVSITKKRLAKVVPGRVFSVTWHPSPQSLITVAGDKFGHIGLWDVNASEEDGTDIVRAFKPHIKPVSDLCFPSGMPHKLYSSSYDATLRSGDFEREVFDEVFSVTAEDDLFRNFNFLDDAHSLLVSHFSGNVSLVDTRTPTKSAEHVYSVSKKSLRTVSVHPAYSHYFITAGLDTNINLWDLRSISAKSPKPIQKLEHHTKVVSSAYFSPTGHRILSCAADDFILVYSVKSGMEIELSQRIHHNNHTGRWLTNFQPTWHPVVEDVFVSGSMNYPREIQIFDTDGGVLKALKDDYLRSVCSLNIFHPYKICTLVGANSSGRLHVFM